MNEAALTATRRQGGSDDGRFHQSRRAPGCRHRKRSRLLNPEERRIVAYHEMGHALVASALKWSDPVHKISIIPRGIGALGYTMQRPTDDRFLISRTDLANRMAVLMGGRAGEQLVFGEVSTGAADDLDRTTEIARAMVTRFGMDGDFGQMVYEPKRQSFLGDNPFTNAVKSYSEDTGQEINVAIRNLVKDAHAVQQTSSSNVGRSWKQAPRCYWRKRR